SGFLHLPFALLQQSHAAHLLPPSARRRFRLSAHRASGPAPDQPHSARSRHSIRRPPRRPSTCQFPVPQLLRRGQTCFFLLRKIFGAFGGSGGTTLASIHVAGTLLLTAKSNVDTAFPIFCPMS